MRSATTGAVSLAALLTALGMAMAEPSDPRTQAPARAAATDSTQTVKATGCLERAANAAAGSATSASAKPASPGASSSAVEMYVLTGARIGGVGVAASTMPDRSSETAEKPTGPPASDTATRLRITGLGAEALRAHVNHQVELQGHLQMAGADPSSAVGSAGSVGTPENTRTTGTPGTTGTTGSGTPSLAGTAPRGTAQPGAPAFVATGVRVIAPTCAGS